MKLRPALARTRQRIHSLRDFSQAVQRRLGLDSHAAVLGFAARLAVLRVRSAAAAQHPAAARRAWTQTTWQLRHYGGRGAHSRSAVFLDVPGNQFELARVQLFRLALEADLPATAIIGLIARDSTVQMQLAAAAGDWAGVLNRPLCIAYAHEAADTLNARDAARLGEEIGAEHLTVLDARWIHDRVGSLLQDPKAAADTESPRGCGFLVRGTDVTVLAAPAGSQRCTAPLPVWSAAANRFGGLVPWIERGNRLLDQAGRTLGAVGLGSAHSAAVVDLCLRLPDGSLFIGGWWTSSSDPVIDIALLDSRSGSGPGPSVSCAFVPRADLPIALRTLIEDLPSEGFVARIESPDSGPKAPAVRIRFASGHAQDLVLQPRACGERMAAATLLLSHLPCPHPELRSLLDTHFGPALATLGNSAPVKAHEIVRRDYGRPPASPRITILVPLYGRDDFLRHQLAHFCGDAGFADIELIYVIDDPRLVQRVEALAPDLAQLFGLAFSTVHAGRNLGYAGANNLGARSARAPVLLLLNSDVIPRGVGWTGPMCAALDRPGTGAVGAKLLFEDGSVQHAGMRSAPYEPWGGLPINLHPGKSLPDTLSRGCEDVPAVTGACLMMRTDLYREVGGLDEGFLVGDFEDSELCARLRRRGLSIRLCHDAVLVHLERQSMPSGAEAAGQARRTLYNAWRAAKLDPVEASS